MACEIDGCNDPAGIGCLAHVSETDLAKVAAGLAPGTALRCSSHSLQGERARMLLSLGRPVDLSGTRILGDLWLPSGPLSGLMLRSARIEGDLRAVDVRVENDAVLDGMEVTGGVSWSMTHVAGTVTGNDLRAGDSIDLLDVTAGGPLTLAGAQVGGDFRMSGESGAGSLDLQNVAVTGDLNVADVKVGADVKADGLVVRGRATLLDCVVGGSLSARRCTFDSRVWFDTLIVGHYVDLSYTVFQASALLSNLVVEGSVVAENLRADQPVRVRVAASQLTVASSRFASGGELGLREEDNGRDAASVVLSGVSYGATLTLLGLPRLDSSAEDWRARVAVGAALPARAAGDPSGPGGVRPRLVSLEDVDASGIVLSRVDLGQCRLRRARNLGSLVVDDLRLSLPTSPRTWRWTSRSVIPEEVLWRQAHARRKPSDNRDPAGGGDWFRPECGSVAVSGDYKHGDVPPDPHEIAGIYRALRTGQESAGNQPGAADFYYGEMEMRRRSPARTAADRGERLLLWLYWLVSGYGLRASRALLALAGVVSLAAVLLHRFGFIDPVSPFGGPDDTVPTRPVGLLSSSALVYTVGAVSSLIGTENVALTPAGLWIRAAVRLLGPLLLGLALLALRGRVKR